MRSRVLRALKATSVFRSTAGTAVAGSGRVPLATPEVPGIVMPRHGLTIDEQGALDVDFSQLPADRFKELLQSLHVPMPLRADMDFFIRQDGSDSNTGLTDSPEGAWRTIQHAVNYVSENYDLRSFRAIVHLGAGSWSERSLCVPAMKASTREADHSGLRRLKQYSVDSEL